MRRRWSGLLLLVFLAGVPMVARAESNIISSVTARADGPKTVVTVHGSSTPSFTAYRLERPARVVVDLADGRFTAVDGPVDVDTWAVGQIGMAQYAGENTRTARVMIGFKRPASYDVRAKGHDVIISITPDEQPPAEALKEMGAKVAEAKVTREKAEAAVAETESRRKRAEEALSKVEQQRADALDRAEKLKAQADAVEAARREADKALKETEAAQRRAEKARAEEESRLKSLREARAEEERRAGKQSEAKKAESDALARAEAARRDAEAGRARAQAAQAELERVAAARKAELQKTVAELAALQRKSADVLRSTTAKRAELELLRVEAEKVAQKRAEEVHKLAEAQAQARKVAEERTARLEEARVAAERREQTNAAARAAEERRAKAQADEAQRLASARNAAGGNGAAERKAQESAEAARREQRKLASLRAEAQRVAEEAARARAEVDRARGELEAMAAAHAQQRAAAEKARLESKRLADQRAQDAAQAAHAAALASGSPKQIEAAEREARRLAEESAKESARLEKVRVETESLAEARAEEARRLDEARAEAKRMAAQHEAELKKLGEARLTEQGRVDAARAEAQRREAELKSLSQARLMSEAELKKLADARQTEQARLESARKETAVLEAELARLGAEKREAKKSADAERASLEQKLMGARKELERLQREKLAVLPTPGKMRAAPAVVESTKLASSGLAKVRDVRFSDDGDTSKVVVDLTGESDYTLLRADPRTAVLRIAHAEIPKKLERTLDTSAYHGPVQSVSTYSEAGDAGAVRVVVGLSGDTANQPEPRVMKDGGQMVWEFPRGSQTADARSYAPQKVGAFGVKLPAQTATAQANYGGQAGGGSVNLGAVNNPNRPRKKTFGGRRIDIDFKDVDIHNLLRLLSDVGQVNIITGDDVKGTVTIRMRDVPWDQALDVILRSKQLGMVREGNLIRVAPAALLEKEVEQEIARAKAQVELKPLDTRLIPLSYADAKEMSQRVGEVLSGRGKVSVDARTNMLIVTDVAGNIALAEDLVRNLDTQTPQVNIEARIVEARSTFLRSFGIQWGGNAIASTATGNPTGIGFPSTIGAAGGAVDQVTNTVGLGPAAASPNYVVNLPAPVGTGSGGALGLTLGSVAGNLNINLRLSALENTGDVRIISAPKITTLDNIEATIEQGVSIPISVVSAAGANTVFVDAKLNLTVKPHVTNEGSVIMNVNITRNEPDFVNTGARGDPTILKKQARTEMLVRDGDTAVIGGIYTRNSGLSFAKVPWFADIPIVGLLFKNRRENDDRTELLIFITPRIVNRAVVSR